MSLNENKIKEEIKEEEEEERIINYISTRNNKNIKYFKDILLSNLCDKKGLFLPKQIPFFTKNQIKQFKKLNFIELSFEIISKFISINEIPSNILKQIIIKSFSKFNHLEIIPCIQKNGLWILELFHGPTFSFKDVALQFLGNLLEYLLQSSQSSDPSFLTILGATSGDTGSAAIEGLRGKKNVYCVILYPDGKVSQIQEKQMISVLDENIFCLAIQGDFDTAQKIVKDIFSDQSFSKEYNLCAINSINWARILVQTTYYFYSYLKISKDDSSLINYCVPTGNFGNILAGYYAKRMGLPIGKLVVCTNENDVLHRFIQTGVYRRLPSQETLAPSMDIAVSSNLERYLYYLSGENSDIVSLWMKTFEITGEVSVGNEKLTQIQQDFLSYCSDRNSILETIRETWINSSYLLCPHSATAVNSAKHLKLVSLNTICLATAHPGKFYSSILQAFTSEENLSFPPLPPIPNELNNLFITQQNKHLIPGNINSIKQFIQTHLSLKKSLQNKENKERKVYYFIIIIILLILTTFIHFKYTK